MSRIKKVVVTAAALAVVGVATAAHAGEKSALPSTVAYSLSVKGMTCETCSAHAWKELAAVPGVVKAEVDYKTGLAWVTVQEQRRSVSTEKQRRVSAELAAAVERAGYKPTLNYVLTIKGMTCEDCAKHVEEAVAKVSGVAATFVNYKGGYAVVVPKAKAGDLSAKLMDAIAESGYRVAVQTSP